MVWKLASFILRFKSNTFNAKDITENTKLTQDASDSGLFSTAKFCFFALNFLDPILHLIQSFILLAVVVTHATY